MSLSLLPYTIIIYIRAVMRKRTTDMAAKRPPATLCLPRQEHAQRQRIMPYKGRRKNPLVRFTAAKLRIFKRLRKPPHGKVLIFNTYSAVCQATARRCLGKVFHSNFPLPPPRLRLRTPLLYKGAAALPRSALRAVFHTTSSGKRQ